MRKLLALVMLVILAGLSPSCGEGDEGEESRLEEDAGDVQEDCGCPE